MPREIRNADLHWRSFYGPNLGYIQEQYERYLQDPDSVSPAFREQFARLGAPVMPEAPAAAGSQPVPAFGDARLAGKAIAAGKWVQSIRTFGHLAAAIDPLEIGRKAANPLLDPGTYGLTFEDLAALPGDWVWPSAPFPLRDGREAAEKLLAIYTGTITYEFSHVHNEEELVWLTRQAEVELPSRQLSRGERIALLNQLIRAAAFEQFLHQTFVGQKRFSAEGVDVIVAVADKLVHELAGAGTRHVLMGMAHRGRLNVLAHVLGKPYELIFSEFHHSPDKRLIPSEGSIGINFGWSGDVKYHLGWEQTAETRLTLANNPSHLEFVNPVVMGFTRAAQEDRSRAGAPVRHPDLAASILLHGDAAFPGEGIVAESLNLNNLAGYTSGGTIHVIVNNRIGFTTGIADARSTHYASDPAKGFEIPIVHVNADDPEACIAAARMAVAYRTKFRKDFLIDLIGYRRHGHNETDDPETTQPLIYRKVKNHPSVDSLYADKLIQSGVVTEADVAQMRAEARRRLQEAYEQIKKRERAGAIVRIGQSLKPPPESPVRTAVEPGRLRQLNDHLLRRPDGFRMHPKLQRILERRALVWQEGGKLDWGHAEALAFASILADGRPIRMSGQDAERATFAHRNLVLHDYETDETYCALQTLPEAKASFAIYNSPLSEAAVLGFEYGYNVLAPETLVIWEAQFGDFANAAQVLFDQFISAGYSKWAQRSSLTMLLPHGYEGQGPEHSSARLERFLQLSAEANWTVASLTSAAQYFHLLRRQAARCGTEEARPLVLMAPKSLIRHPLVASNVRALSEGAFRKILEQPGLGLNPERVVRLILCSGKVAIDLAEALDQPAGGEPADRDWLHIVRVEQLYPFPAREIGAVLSRMPNVREVVWVQEEPQNMGAWTFVEPRIRGLVPAHAAIRYIGRPERASPASGFQQVHAFEQQMIVSQALTPPRTRKETNSGGNGDG